VHPQRETVATEEVAAAKARRARRPGAANSVPITGLIPNLAVHYARCCHPIPGDRIVGIVVTGKGVTIHTIDCDTLENFRDEPERWLDVAWSDQGAGVPFTGRLNVAISNLPGTLGTLTTVVGKSGANITNLKFTHRSRDFFELLLDVEVEDLRHLSMVMAVLRTSPVVHGVSRAHSG
jgi:GTP pyrophosphokinase